MFTWILLLIPVVAGNYHLTCYYTWNRPTLKDVDVSLCTHIILIGQTILDEHGQLLLPSDELSWEFSQLKKQRKDLKLLICLTGPNTAFTTLVASPQTMSRLANDSLVYLKKFNLDGIDIDWEFPTWSPDGHKTDRARFPLLLKTLREKYGSDFLITLAVSGPPTITRVAYDVPSFNRYVDLVQVMNYDYHIYSYFRPFVGFNAPLRRLKGELGAIGEMNSEAAMATFSKLGLWSNKTVFGIPTYGRGYRLMNWRINKPYAPATGADQTYANFPELCKLLADRKRYTYVWNEQAASPYIYGIDKLWDSFEDDRSVRAKAQYAKQLNIAGVMVFQIGADDVLGSCGNGTYPLIRAIKQEIQ
ncbi:glycosyl hydrolase, family 18 [Ancylostoma caninum]|uniref:Glycosyl hydrolase, family 18 n=1 Tax=Ancylostoma caninum TaxID=29170 RepID=A0A368GYW7_ANCCA|nr:glycosyl hydrolase, family 18 [Ancylostoma caninum]